MVLVAGKSLIVHQAEELLGSALDVSKPESSGAS